MKALSSFATTFRNSKLSGKIAIGCSTLLFLCICVSVPMALFSDVPTQTPTVQNILTPVYETSQAIGMRDLTQTALAFSPVPTATLEPTHMPIEPTDTPIPILPTATLEPAIALPANVASCVPTGTTREEGTVIGIVDGDTIDVAIGNETYRVRYIGIDTPEKDEAYYWLATGENQNLVYGKQISLIKDVSETDRYNRILRYIFVGETFVNYELVKRGYAHASTYPPDVACADYFAQAQTQAQADKAGLWAPAPTAVVLPTAPPSSGGGGSSGNCHPAYPGVCIPPPPPDLNCKDVPYKRFQVLPPDPHNFDGDGDGVGCES